MSLPIKLGVGALALGSIGGIAYAGISYSQQGNEISKLIEEEFQYKLLDTKAGDNNPDKDKWTAIWQEYKKSSNNVFSLEGWKTNNTEFDLTEKLKEKCRELSTKKVSDSKDATYSNVARYCGRWVTIKDQLAKDSIVPIDTIATANTPWGDIAKKTQELGTHFTNLEIKAKSTGVAITEEEVKTGCTTALKKDKSDKKFSTIYNSFKEVCVTKG